MIDYDKLKIAHNLAYEFTKINWPRKCIISIEFQCSEYVISAAILEDGKIIFDFDYQGDIDYVIEKLTELTQPKPKYKVGDIVYTTTIGPPHNLIELKIKSFDYNHDEEIFGYSFFDSFHFRHEDCLYSSKEALIEARIEYWEGLRIVEKTQSAIKLLNEGCDHESNGQVYNENGFPRLPVHVPCHDFPYYKCIRCEVFFK